MPYLSETEHQNLQHLLLKQEDRIASLEALVRELADGVIAVRDLMAESGGVYGLHLNGDPSPWGELTEGGRFEEWLINYSAAESALSHPIVSELTGEKTEKCPICGGTGWGDPDMPEECATCCGTGEKEGGE